MAIDLPPAVPPPTNAGGWETAETKTTTSEAAAESPVRDVEHYFPSRAELATVLDTIGIHSRAADTAVRAPSKWWPSPNVTMDVDINGYDFDFIPMKNIGKEKVQGDVDGPLNHNGSFRIVENHGNRFEMRVNIGTDPAQTNDLNVRIVIQDGKASVWGTVEGKELGPEGVSAKVTGSGTASNPFAIDFTNADGTSTYSIKWRPE